MDKYTRIDEIIRAHVKPGQLEGGLYYEHLSMNPRKDYVEKAKFLAKFALDKSNVAEIGFNAGHSALVILTGMSTGTFTSFDINEHAYTMPCMDYVSSLFPQVVFHRELGNSVVSLATCLAKKPEFDFIHVDGSHHQFNVAVDLSLSRLLLTKGGVMVVDDMDYPRVAEVVDWFLRTYKDMYVLERTNAQIALEKLA